MRYAVIDLGSNTIRLAVYYMQNDSAVRLFSTKKFVQAVTYRKQNVLTDEGIGVISKTLASLCDHAGFFGLSALWCFATASLRGIANQVCALTQIKAATGLDIEILSEEHEAALGVAGFLSLHHEKDALIADLGGGSCELSLLCESRMAHTVSLPLGSLLMAERYVSAIFPDNAQSKRIEEDTRVTLQSIGWLQGCRPPAFYAMGGGARAIFRLHRALSGAQKASGSLSPDDLGGLFSRLIADQTQSLRHIDRHCPGRLTTLIPSILILRQIMQSTEASSLMLCAAGLREGYLQKKLSAL